MLQLDKSRKKRGCIREQPAKNTLHNYLESKLRQTVDQTGGLSLILLLLEQ